MRRNSTITITDQFCGAGGSSLGAVKAGAELKCCRVCGLEKPLNEFYKRPESSDGLRSECKTCTKARATASVNKRKGEVAAYNARYRQQNHERLVAQAKARVQQNPRSDYYWQYRQANIATVRENERRWRANHKAHEAARRHQRRALELDAETREYIKVLLLDLCSYCGGPGGTIDHIVPVAKGGTNHWTNLTAACKSCNSSKHDRDMLHFIVNGKNTLRIASRKGQAVTSWSRPTPPVTARQPFLLDLKPRTFQNI